MWFDFVCAVCFDQRFVFAVRVICVVWLYLFRLLVCLYVCFMCMCLCGLFTQFGLRGLCGL